MTERKQSGFTLIELMITVAVIGILAVVAYPSYQNQVRASRRAEAESDLLQLANFMERFFTENGRYDRDLAGAQVALPFAQSPHGGTNIAYSIALTSVNQGSYILKATPIHAQTKDGYHELLSNGVKRWDQNNNYVIDAGESDWEK
ncbi:MAG: type IV pilin protein [Methylococcales bacterium]